MIGLAYRCPKCGRDLDCHHCANGPETQVPAIGDIIVCHYCKTVTEVVDNRAGFCKALTEEELGHLPGYIVKNIEAYLLHK